jgi:protease IV
MLPLLTALVAAAPVERPALPFHGAALEDGAHTLYLNPALLNFDRDPAYAAYYTTQDLLAGSGNGVSFLATGSGVGAGVSYREQVAGPDWWTLSSGVSVRLANSLSLGSGIHWQLPEGGDNNFVSWDLGLAWRPTPWLGIGGAALNLGSPAPDLDVYSRYDAGIALRPAGDLLTLGLDYRADAGADDSFSSTVEASVRVRAARGVWVRAWADRSLQTEAPIGLGGSLELHFADIAVGAGGSGGTGGAAPAGTGYVTSLRGDDQLFLPGRQVAEIAVEGSFPYQPQASLFSEPQESYFSLLRRLDSASDDPSMRGILLRLDGVQLSVAQLEELRGLVKKARRAGKSVAAWLGGSTSNGSYLLASACDKVYLHPAAGLDLVGISAEVQYFKGAMELVGVGAQYAQRSEYKSGPEPFTRTGASPAAAEEMDDLVDDLYDTLITGISEGRGRSPEEARAWIDGGPYSAREALAKGLVDGLYYPDQLDDQLETVFPDDYHLVHRYGKQVDESGWKPQRAVAVVVVDGTIAGGQSSPGGFLSGPATGSESVVAALEEAADSRAIKAVLLRVDSPGGSAFASDEIWRAVERVKESGKPVVVSMGGYAASGGYYVAAGADSIWAEPSTITGSIGVYGGKYNAEGLFGKLGITTEITARGRNASMYSMSRPMDDIEYAALDRLIGETYDQFKERVAKGRDMKPEEVEAVARGRVWSGARAKEQRLVDNHGGFFDALDDARVRAGMDPRAPYTLVLMDPWSGPTSLPGRVALAGRQLRAAVAPKLSVPAEVSRFWQLSALKETRVFALMPYELQIK